VEAGRHGAQTEQLGLYDLVMAELQVSQPVSSTHISRSLSSPLARLCYPFRMGTQLPSSGGSAHSAYPDDALGLTVGQAAFSVSSTPNVGFLCRLRTRIRTSEHTLNSEKEAGSDQDVSSDEDVSSHERGEKSSRE
jgi:hypothetical protein